MAYSYATDIVPARRLADHIRAFGLTVSIELQAGAGGTGWLDVRHRLNMSHHVASKRSQGLTPFLALVKNGRGGTSPVPGPLANGYMGFDRVYRIITMGRANHPGAGGPITLDGITVPKNQGRQYVWGTEFEGGMEPWSDDMHDAMARANAGITAWLAADHGRTINANLEHKDWAPTRKIDRLGYTRAESIRRIRAVTPPPAPAPAHQEDDMTPDQWSALQRVEQKIDQLVKPAIGTTTEIRSEQILKALDIRTGPDHEIRANLRAVKAEQAAQREILDQLAAGGHVQIDWSKVEETFGAALDAALADVELLPDEVEVTYVRVTGEEAAR